MGKPAEKEKAVIRNRPPVNTGGFPVGKISLKQGKRQVTINETEKNPSGVHPGEQRIRRGEETVKKRLLTLIMAAALLCPFPAAAAGEGHRTDLRIPRITTVFECGCEHTYLGAMAGRYGMVLSPYSLYCGEHGKKYREISFAFGLTEENEPALEYSGKFTFQAYESLQKESVKWENVIAYIRFREPVGDQTGWFECRVVPDSELEGRKLVRRRNVSTETDPSGIREDTITADVAGEKELSYDRGDFVTGTPVILAAEDGGEILVGLCNCWHGDRNYVRRITKRVYSDMKNAGIFR